MASKKGKSISDFFRKLPPGASADEHMDMIIDNDVQPAEPSTSSEGLSSAPEVEASKSNVDIILPISDDKPHHPNVNNIPLQVLSTKSLKFQDKWFQQYPWLHWDGCRLLCFYCHKLCLSTTTGKVGKSEDVFASKGFSNWKKAHERFKQHQSSQMHLMAIKQGQATRVIEQLNVKSKLEQASSRKALTAIFASIKYLARQGVALLGDTEDQSNLMQLLKMRADDNIDLALWLRKASNETKTTRHLLSHDIQNEMLKDISHAILRKIREEIHDAKHFSISCDGTQDISGQEQESISVRYVDENLNPQAVFLGLYETDNTSGKAIADIILDVMTRLSLPLANLRGQVFDGASNMSGIYNGAQALILEKQPLAYYMHCAAHCINLVAQSVANLPLLRDAVSSVNELGVLFSRTIKFRNILKYASSQDHIAPKTLRPLCPTRWTVRHSAIQEVLDSYGLIKDSLDLFVNTANISQEQKSKAAGLLRYLDRGETFLALKIGAIIFAHLEKLVKVSSSRNVTLDGILNAKEVFIQALEIERNNFAETFKECCDSIHDLDLQELKSQRKRKPPKRLSGPAENVSASTTEEYYRIRVIEAYDTAMQQLNSRFDQSKSGLASYLLLSSCWKTDDIFDNSSDVSIEIQKYPEIDINALRSGLKVLHSKLSAKQTLDDAVTFLTDGSQEVQSLFQNFETILRLVIVRPSASVECERSFSALRRLKTWLRSTMTQTRLNSVAVIHVHRNLCDQINMNKLINDFVSRNDWRLTMFGKAAKEI